MLKQLLTVGVISLIASHACFAATESDPFHLAGTYLCHGNDSHDGDYADATATLTLDAKNSDFKHNYGAYHFSLVEPDGVTYDGEAVGSGNVLAIHFRNTATSAATDNGTGLAWVTHDRDSHGNVTTEFHKFYYEPMYQGGGSGSEICVKENLPIKAKLKA